MSKELIVSYSSLDKYARCPYAYYLKYIVRESTEEADYTGTIPGNVAHKLAEMFFDHKHSTGELDWSIWDERFDEVFYKYVKTAIFSSEAFAKDKAEAYKKIKDWSDNLKRMIQNEHLATGYTVSELRFGDYKNPMRMTDKILFTGGPDLFHAPTKEDFGRLIDYKASESTFHLNDRQLILYAIALEKKLDLKIAMVGFFLFKNGTIAWRRNSDERKEEAIMWAEDIIDKIHAEKFDYTPSKTACRLCDFRTTCEHSSYRVEKTKSVIRNMHELRDADIDFNFEIPKL